MAYKWCKCRNQSQIEKINLFGLSQVPGWRAAGRGAVSTDWVTPFRVNSITNLNYFKRKRSYGLPILQMGLISILLAVRRRLRPRLLLTLFWRKPLLVPIRLYHGDIIFKSYLRRRLTCTKHYIDFKAGISFISPFNPGINVLIKNGEIFKFRFLITCNCSAWMT